MYILAVIFAYFCLNFILNGFQGVTQLRIGKVERGGDITVGRAACLMSRLLTPQVLDTENTVDQDILVSCFDLMC